MVRAVTVVVQLLPHSDFPNPDIGVADALLRRTCGSGCDVDRLISSILIRVVGGCELVVPYSVGLGLFGRHAFLACASAGIRVGDIGPGRYRANV